HTVFHAIHNFCAVDLSALYLDVIKDRLYTSAARDPRRRAAQTTCYDVFQALSRLLAPILSFTAEEAWRHLPGAEADRQRPRGLLTDLRRAGGPARAARRQAANLADALHRLARRDRRRCG